jgi:hypothetical protein
MSIRALAALELRAAFYPEFEQKNLLDWTILFIIILVHMFKMVQQCVPRHAKKMSSI